MHPRVVIEPRSGFELAVAVGLVLWAVLGARAWRRQKSVAGLFGAYFGGLLFLLVVVHALGERPFAVSTYAVFLLLGAFAAWKMLLVRLPEAGLPMRGVYAIIAGCLVLGVVGSRVAEVLADRFTGQSAPLLEGRIAGLGVFGALALDVVYVTALLKLAFPGVSLLLVLDAGAAPTLVNVAFARVGCLFAGCCFGAPTRSSLGLPVAWFDPSSPARIASEGAAALWPTQPLEVALAAALAWVCHRLWMARNRLALAPGAVIGFAAIGYGVGRFLLELVRGDSMRLRSGLTIWQYCALALVAAGLGAALPWRPQRTAS